jgi:hypothetical protein
MRTGEIKVLLDVIVNILNNVYAFYSGYSNRVFVPCHSIQISSDQIQSNRSILGHSKRHGHISFNGLLGFQIRQGIQV